MYRSPTTEDMGDLVFDYSRSLVVRFDSTIGLPIYGLLLIVNSNISPN